MIVRLVKIVILCSVVQIYNPEAANQIVENIKILGEHDIVTDSERFPYVAAILRKFKYISAGALIDENWVLTAADSLFLVRESIRLLHIRLGSADYRTGGVLRRIKYIKIHPSFDDRRPQYDVALIKLSQPIKLNLGLNPIQLQRKPRNVTASYFVIATWQASSKIDGNIQIQDGSKQPQPTKIDKSHLLTASRLEPMDSEDCEDQLETFGFNRTDTVMCLDLSHVSNPCQRDPGAPVSLNGVLWGVVSTWKSEECDIEHGPIFVSLVSTEKTSSWIHSTIQNHRWSLKHFVDYKDNFI